MKKERKKNNKKLGKVEHNVPDRLKIRVKEIWGTKVYQKLGQLLVWGKETKWEKKKKSKIKMIKKLYA